MKIDTKPLQIGVDSIDVAGTWSQVDKADELMIASYEISDKQNDMLKALKAEREFLKNAMDFFKELFKLKPKQIEHIYKQVPGDTLNLYVSYVCGCVKGATGSFADFEKDVKKEQESAPKGDPVTSND